MSSNLPVDNGQLPADDGVDDVLVGEGGGQQGHKVVLSHAPPHLPPVHTPTQRDIKLFRFALTYLFRDNISKVPESRN